MATLPHNIEKSAFRRGEYIGYAAGKVWRIVKSTSSFGAWQAFPRDGGNVFVYAFRLSDMGGKLAALKD